MRVLVTGAQGFVGKNLCVALAERNSIEVRHFTRDTPSDMLPKLLEGVDVVFHLAGVNRPQDPTEFQKGNTELTQLLCDAIRTNTHPVRVVYTSSSQAELDNPYGKSKKQAEQALLGLERERPGSIFIAQLPNVFGKWARPHYNSAVATFCHNITRDLPITIHDRQAEITLVYIDTVVRHFMAVLDGQATAQHGYLDVQPQSRITVGALADLLASFKHSRETLMTEHVGVGLTRELYSTYVSYLPTERFSYDVPKYGDPRGVFVEMLKTPDCGQFSYFTAHPGITRGGHYHHTKTEKFLVIKGQALFRFRQIDTGDYYELTTSGETPKIVETVPGWTHDITNTGDDEMVVMLWANEVFDRQHPDTITCPL